MATTPTQRRIGGLLALAAVTGILLFEVILPQAIAGPRVTGTTDAAAIRAYWSHAALAPLLVGQALAGVLFLAGAVILALHLAEKPAARTAAWVALAFVIAEIPILLTKAAAQAALIASATAGAEVVALFRFWDVLYNSVLYLLEAGLLVGFGLAMRAGGYPRWLATLSLAVGALQMVNVAAIWIGLPDAATLPANLGFTAWFVGVGWTLLRTPAGEARAAGLPAGS